MKLTQPPFRADHVGSLLRPKELLHAREEHRQGRINAAQLQAIEDDAIRAVVKMQEDLGLQGITDGEFRRSSWHIVLDEPAPHIGRIYNLRDPSRPT